MYNLLLRLCFQAAGLHGLDLFAPSGGFADLFQTCGALQRLNQLLALFTQHI